ncbi:MAG TPA: ARMT1-like domain-containing protein [Geobacteraceae bacterium]|nr:ARMT1-like domain-containing protein [Geobacteraceae bacterium]
MNTYLDCIPCFARQALEAARFVTDDPAIHESVMRGILREAAQMDFSQSPPAIGQKLHRTLRDLTRVDDPYREIKDHCNQAALEMLPDLSARIRDSADPLFTALRVAIAGNVIDLGVNGHIRGSDVKNAMANILNEPFHGNIEDFRDTVRSARKILYLADNAGEIVFDRLLIEQLPLDRVTLAVRGTPVLNDATRVDAEAAGLHDLVEVINNGSDAPGTILTDCSRDFRRRFSMADLVIAKGQGNFETLSDTNADIFFLFKAKCPVIANHVGLPVGTHVAIRGRHAHPCPGDGKPRESTETMAGSAGKDL